MVKMFLTITLFLICLKLSAPPSGVIAIIDSEPVQVFDKMLYAFQKVESNFDTDTINRLGYGGILQIGQEMINEANRICRIKEIPQSFTLTDRLDSIKSVRVWYIVQNYWNESYTLKKACMVWNPLASVNYYNKIKRLL
jgi:hypothetical protein